MDSENEKVQQRRWNGVAQEEKMMMALLSRSRAFVAEAHRHISFSEDVTFLFRHPHHEASAESLEKEDS